jgi:hypothetical protein
MAIPQERFTEIQASTCHNVLQRDNRLCYRRLSLMFAGHFAQLYFLARSEKGVVEK